MIQVQAIANNIRISPQKVRLIVNQIKKISPQKSIAILDHVPQKASKPLKNVIASAIANAKNNYGLEVDSLTFKEVNVNKGQVFKRFRAVARGRAHSILKRTANIKVVLEGEEKKISQDESKVKDQKEGVIGGSKS